MDDQQPGTIIVEAIVGAFSQIATALAPIIQQVGAALVTVVTAAMQETENAYYYRRDVGLPYDPARIVRGSLANEVLLLPERAESLEKTHETLAEERITPRL